jgi:hypothetical protein
MSRALVARGAGAPAGARPCLVLLALVASLAAGCTLPATGPAPPPVAPGAGAERFGATGDDVLRHPEVAARLPAVFGPDWLATGDRGGAGTTRAASQFFRRTAAPRALRVGERSWVAVPGCLPAACATHRGLLLVSEDGRELRARLDEGGFRHHYGFGPRVRMDEAERLAVDAAWRWLERLPGTWPGGG